MPKYTEFSIDAAGNLVISLTEDGKQEKADIVRADWGRKFYVGEYKFDMGYWVEWQLGTGWEFVLPAQVGALTDAPILSDDILIDDIGEVRSVGRVFWYPNYQVSNPVDVLLRDGSVTFQKGD